MVPTGTYTSACSATPPGRAYVYQCYGLHQLLNIVTGGEGDARAVLVRACEPVEGLATVHRRRGDKRGPELLTGPGKVGSALALDPTWCHHPLYVTGGLELHDGPAPAQTYSAASRVQPPTNTASARNSARSSGSSRS